MEMFEHSLDLFPAQYDGEADGLLSSNDAKVFKLTSKNLTIEKKQRAPRLQLSRSRYLPLRCQAREELRNFLFAKILRASSLVEADVPFDPKDVAFFGSRTVVPRS
jgi:hypothetical protein